MSITPKQYVTSDLTAYDTFSEWIAALSAGGGATISLGEDVDLDGGSLEIPANVDLREFRNHAKISNGTLTINKMSARPNWQIFDDDLTVALATGAVPEYLPVWEGGVSDYREIYPGDTGLKVIADDLTAMMTLLADGTATFVNDLYVAKTEATASYPQINVTNNASEGDGVSTFCTAAFTIAAGDGVAGLLIAENETDNIAMRLKTTNGTGLILGANDTDLFYVSDADGTAQGVGILGLPANGEALTVYGTDGYYLVGIHGGTTSDNSFGLYVAAGTTANDYALLVKNGAEDTTALIVSGEGCVGIGGDPLGNIFSVTKTCDASEGIVYHVGRDNDNVTRSDMISFVREDTIDFSESGGSIDIVDIPDYDIAAIGEIMMSPTECAYPGIATFSVSGTNISLTNADGLITSDAVDPWDGKLHVNVDSNGHITLQIEDSINYITLSFESCGFIQCVPGDVGKTVTGASTGDTGTLVSYDNDEKTWVVTPTDNGDLFDESEGITISGGTGAGTTSGAGEITGYSTYPITVRYKVSVMAWPL